MDSGNIVITSCRLATCMLATLLDLWRQTVDRNTFVRKVVSKLVTLNDLERRNNRLRALSLR